MSTITGTVPLAREFALYFDGYEGVLNTQHLWMGSVMIVDEPTFSNSLETAQSAQYVSTTSIPAGSKNMKMDIFHVVPKLNAMADVGKNIGGSQSAKYLCLKKRILICSLQKAVSKCINSSCEGVHPTTNLLQEHIYMALEVVLLDIRECQEDTQRHIHHAWYKVMPGGAKMTKHSIDSAIANGNGIQ
ncbi:hypothetical protein BDR06DRAFT_977617 [Suillus hirtellus]|nr:hypothetical protein BDR06DRAFT_977617 [Suillus hirtellus]